MGLLDAVRLALANNPDIQLQEKQIELSQGALQQAAGQFDPALRLTVERTINNTPLNQLDSVAYAGAAQSTIKKTTYGVALDKTLRNGIVLSPSLSTTSTTGTVYDIQNLSAQNQGNINFSIRVPMMKGRGDAVAANEAAANLDWEASKQDFRFAISKNVLNVVSNYWNLLAAANNLAVAGEAEAGIRKMVADTRKLIEADEIPAADLYMIRANLQDKAAARITAEQALRDARQRLGEAIGLSYQRIASLEPIDTFPALSADIAMLRNQRQRLLDLAMQRRADRVAAQLRQDSARTLTSAAQANLKSQLDVTVNLGYTGLSEGGGSGAILGGLDQTRGGLNIGTSLSYRWPFDNNAARGLFRQQAALYDQGSIRVAHVERTIGIGVESALTSLVHSLQQLKESEEAVALYRISLDNEKIKHQLGTATIVDVLVTNDRFLSARQNNISYQLNVLIALARLNFETGAMLLDDKAGESIRLDQLIGVPTPDSSRLDHG